MDYFGYRVFRDEMEQIKYNKMYVKTKLEGKTVRTNLSKLRDSKGEKFKPWEWDFMHSGRPATTQCNSYVNIQMMTAIMTEMCYQNVSLDNLPAFLTEKYTDFGIIPKIKIHRSISSSTFLKGTFLRTGSDTYVWTPLLTWVLKFGKICNDLSVATEDDFPVEDFLEQQFLGIGVVTNTPLGKVFHKKFVRTCGRKKPYVPKTLKDWEVDLSAQMVDEPVLAEAFEEWCFQRYTITREELHDFYSFIEELTVPCSYTHIVTQKILKTEYGEYS